MYDFSTKYQSPWYCPNSTIGYGIASCIRAAKTLEDATQPFNNDTLFPIVPSDPSSYNWDVYSEHFRIQLDLEGCEIDGRQNCTAKCSTPDGIFSSMTAFRNCLAFPTIASLVASGRLEPLSASAAKDMGIDNNSFSVADKVSSLIYQCSTQFLRIDQSTMGRNKEASRWLDKSIPSKFQVNKLFSDGKIDKGIYTYPNVCKADRPVVNADIAGIGAYVTFFVQASLSLAIFLLLKLFTTSTFSIVYLICRCMMRPGTLAAKKATVSQNRLRRQLGALTTASVDFHKTQCYFQLAVQAASLVAITQNPSQFRAFSLQQLSNNQTFLAILAYGGIVPISFTLACLHFVDKSSTYLILLSLVTVSISTAIYSKSGAFSSDVSFLSNVPPLDGVTECGSANPLKICPYWLGVAWGGERLLASSQYSDTRDVVIVVWSWLALSVVAIEKFSGYWLLGGKKIRPIWPPSQSADSSDGSLTRKHPRQTNTSILGQRAMPFAQSESRFRQTLKHDALLFSCFILSAFWKGVRPQSREQWVAASAHLWYIVFVTYFVVSFIVYFDDLLNLKRKGGLNPFDWGFGQIVAIAVFIPNVIEYLYLVIRGVKEGLQYRLPSRYVIQDLDDPSDYHGSTIRDPGTSNELVFVEPVTDVVYRMSKGRFAFLLSLSFSVAYTLFIIFILFAVRKFLTISDVSDQWTNYDQGLSYWRLEQAWRDNLTLV